MGKHDNSKRGFIWSSRAWYARVGVDCDHQLSFGMYSEGGGTTGEMTMVWHDIGGTMTPRLECFDDAWHALHAFSDLLAKMAEVDNKSISEERFMEMLKECGFEDMTQYEQK